VKVGPERYEIVVTFHRDGDTEPGSEEHTRIISIAPLPAAARFTLSHPIN
jgi:hypothetical protein